MVVLLIQPIAILMFSLPSPRGIFRELKQQGRWRLQKRHLKSEVALPQTLSRLFHLVQFIKCWQFSLQLNSKRLHWSSGKEKESRCLVFSSSIKREIRHFHVLVVQWRLRNKTKQRVARASGSFSRMNKWRVEDERTTDVPSYNFFTCEQQARTSAYKGAAGSRSQSIYELTVPTQPMMRMMWWVKVDHDTRVYVPYSFRTMVWVLLRPTRTR